MWSFTSFGIINKESVSPGGYNRCQLSAITTSARQWPGAEVR
jgi:hypothetical protein